MEEQRHKSQSSADVDNLTRPSVLIWVISLHLRLYHIHDDLFLILVHLLVNSAHLEIYIQLQHLNYLILMVYGRSTSGSPVSSFQGFSRYVTVRAPLSENGGKGELTIHYQTIKP